MKSQKQRFLILIIVTGIAAAGGVWWNSSHTERNLPPGSQLSPADLSPEPLQPLNRVQSRFRNTGREAKYVGNDRCVDCHADEYKSYLQTAHSQALRTTEAPEEPASAKFFHEASGRWYAVYRQGESLRHRESVRDDSGRELVLNDRAADYTIGSGRFSLTYLTNDSGFWIESPITWYAARERWAMSPGYDRPVHQGFQRLAEVGCVVCHAGRVVAREENTFHPQILQMSIGCESCHGPGSLHVAYRESGADSNESIDVTIVNPAHLDRDLREDICANCHLRGDATVLRRGLEVNDYRPGLPLNDVRIDFGLQSPSGEMEVVGHVEQMRQSLCYRQSESMTCTTCHDPHHQPAPEARLEYFRSVCLRCHTRDACGVPHAVRLQQETQDNCVACHMPNTETDIPHFAFTHHRIAVHESGETLPANPASSKPLGRLVPLAATSHLSQAESDRLSGLAYLEFAEKHPQHYRDYLDRARILLERGERDGDSLAALARIYWEMGAPPTADYARQALQFKQLSSRARVNALVVLADLSLRQGQWDLAVNHCRKLVNLRRHSGYWEMLAQAHAGARNIAEAVSALEQAVEIAPDRIEFRKPLADFYRRTGRLDDAEQQFDAIDILQSRRPQSPNRPLSEKPTGNPTRQ